MKTFSEFNRVPVLHRGFFLGILFFLAGYWLLFPSDLNAARFYVSRGRIDRAVVIYDRILADPRLRCAERIEVLRQVAALRRWSGDMPDYLAAMTALAMEGGAESAPLSDALVCARALAVPGPAGAAARDAAALFEKILAHREH